jgi:predicted MPP superfamily phosphohydrolase
MFFNKIKNLFSSFSPQSASAKISTRIVCISDTHANYDFILPDGDILIHAGDLSNTGKHEEMEYFLSWLKTLTKFRLKIIIAGNHDITLDQIYYEKSWRRFHDEQENSQKIIDMFNNPILRDDYGIIYLQDQSFIDPVTELKFYGRFIE